MKTNIENYSEMIKESQSALKSMRNKEMSVGEAVATMKLVKGMNDTARTKLQYNMYQADHNKIEYLEDK